VMVQSELARRKQGKKNDSSKLQAWHWYAKHTPIEALRPME
jgi:hypothetical protein